MYVSLCSKFLPQNHTSIKQPTYLTLVCGYASAKIPECLEISQKSSNTTLMSSGRFLMYYSQLTCAMCFHIVSIPTKVAE